MSAFGKRGGISGGRPSFGTARPMKGGPGGAFVGVTHNRRAWLNRLLGRRSPIVDVEHMQLFSPRSSTNLLTLNGYSEVGGSSFWNRYRPGYWLRLVPMSRQLKDRLTASLRGSWLDARRVPLNVGNFMSWGFRP